MTPIDTCATCAWFAVDADAALVKFGVCRSAKTKVAYCWAGDATCPEYERRDYGNRVN